VTIFGYYIGGPRSYGVAKINARGSVVSIEEKPKQPKSNFAVVGLYFYHAEVVQIARDLEPSARGQDEITDVNREYLRRGTLNMEILGRITAWLDSGTHESLIQASTFIQTIEDRQGFKISCPEKIAFRQGWIDANQLRNLADLSEKSTYGRYLREVADDSKLNGMD